ncbi:hypothetical protein [Pseudomonas sp. R1-43-08]|uniref:hypothetical protein n=1 Tax=Pseudomonas sp. R1-43-08 TaxID=1173270 RepID=UPI000F58AD6C|nr:hypothetical protein [Pseudomonas sp. R1-43-08]
MKQFHEEAKADADSILHGDEYIVATEFLIDAVLGEVKSLGIKAGGGFCKWYKSNRFQAHAMQATLRAVRYKAQPR